MIPPAPENSSSAMTNDELADMSNEGPLQSILEIFKNKVIILHVNLVVKVLIVFFRKMEYFWSAELQMETIPQPP